MNLSTWTTNLLESRIGFQGLALCIAHHKESFSWIGNLRRVVCSLDIDLREPIALLAFVSYRFILVVFLLKRRDLVQIDGVFGSCHKESVLGVPFYVKHCVLVFQLSSASGVSDWHFLGLAASRNSFGLRLTCLNSKLRLRTTYFRFLLLCGHWCWCRLDN